MYYPRSVFQKIKRYINSKEIIAIKGARQVGKTTLLKIIEKDFKDQGKDVRFLSFENHEVLDLFDNDIDAFKALYANKYDVVLIDEFQYSEKAGKHLKFLYDETSTKFIITGSSSLELTGKTGKYLVGRMFSFNLKPFSFVEFLNVIDPEIYELKNKIGKEVCRIILKERDNLPKVTMSLVSKLLPSCERLMVYGGYPRVVISKTTEEKRLVLENIIDTYLLRDIKGLLNLATSDEIVKLAKALALQIGNLVVYKELSNLTGLNYKQVVRHLSILEQTFIINLIKPYFTNKRKELVKNPKVYFVDTGMRNSVIKDFNSLGLRADKGALVENYIATSLQGLNFSRTINFWRTQMGAEVDFVVQEGKKLIPIEVKYSSFKKPVIGKSLHSFIKRYRPERGVIFTKDYLEKVDVKGCKIFFLPVCLM